MNDKSYFIKQGVSIPLNLFLSLESILWILKKKSDEIEKLDLSKMYVFPKICWPEIFILFHVLVKYTNLSNITLSILCKRLISWKWLYQNLFKEKYNML